MKSSVSFFSKKWLWFLQILFLFCFYRLVLLLLGLYCRFIAFLVATSVNLPQVEWNLIPLYGCVFEGQVMFRWCNMVSLRWQFSQGIFTVKCNILQGEENKSFIIFIMLCPIFIYSYTVTSVLTPLQKSHKCSHLYCDIYSFWAFHFRAWS